MGRIFTDYFLFLIRVNPHNPSNPCPIVGCGLAALGTTHHALRTTHYAANRLVLEL